MKAVLKNKKEVAKGTMLFEFETEEEVSFKPGQIFFVTLDGNLVHHFTISNSPNEKKILSLTTRMRDSKFKNALKDLSIGTEVTADRISGSFVLPETITKPFVFIALGIGITPYISMLRFIKEEKLAVTITLIYSDSDQASMAYLNELKELEQSLPNFKLILTVTKEEGWTGEKRHIDESFIKDYFKEPKENVYYISGPPQAVEAVTQSLEKAGIEEENIKSENFSGY